MRLDSYFYIYNQITPNPKFATQEPPDLDFKVSARLHETSESIDCLVQLDVTPENTGNFPYAGIIRIYGVFKPDNTLNKEAAAELVKSTGANILVGALREKLMSETSTGPFPPLFLPPVMPSDIEFV